MKRIITSNGFELIDNAGKQAVKVMESEKDKVYVVTLSGAISYDCTYEVADELYALLSCGKELVLDIGGLTYVSDAFASQLVHLEANAEAKGHDSVLIQNMPKDIYDALKRNHCISSLDYEMKVE